jgi:hypothetical protein
VAKAAIRNRAIGALRPPITGDKRRKISRLVPVTIIAILKGGIFAANRIAAASSPVTISPW